MKSIVSTTCTQNVLETLKIKYRMSIFSDGVLYFCTLPISLTFDMFEDNIGNIKIWRFVGASPTEKVTSKWEYINKSSLLTVGIEITDEGDICFYTKQNLKTPPSKRDHLLKKLIIGYINIISDIDFYVK